MHQAHEIEALINGMALTVRTTSDLPAPAKSTGRWWVLLCGEAFDPQDFAQREQARETLRKQAARGGITPAEYVWIWDEGHTAQLLAKRFDDQELAEKFAQNLTERGLRTRLIESWND